MGEKNQEMFQQYQCQLCLQKCKDSTEFLNHFETHMNQNSETQNLKQNAKCMSQK